MYETIIAFITGGAGTFLFKTTSAIFSHISELTLSRQADRRTSQKAAEEREFSRFGGTDHSTPITQYTRALSFAALIGALIILAGTGMLSEPRELFVREEFEPGLFSVLTGSTTGKYVSVTTATLAYWIYLLTVAMLPAFIYRMSGRVGQES